MSEPHEPIGGIFDAPSELPPERRAAYVLVQVSSLASDDSCSNHLWRMRSVP